MKTTSRGFTLLELMVASGVAGVVSLAAFAAVTNMQRATGAQLEATQTVSAGRLGLELMLRDIRSAGASSELFTTHCIAPGSRHPAAVSGCPALLEAHPWRIIIARNSWTPPAPPPGAASASPYAASATAPPATATLASSPNNVVAYEFVPTAPQTVLQVANLIGPGTHARTVIRGQIHRIVDPWGFGPNGPQRMVLVDNVMLDNAMRCDPANPTTSGAGGCDGRYDFALFSYRVAARPGQLVGDANLVGAARNTQSGVLLSPPMNFYPATAPLGNGNFEGMAPTAQHIAGAPSAAADVRGLDLGAGGVAVFDLAGPAVDEPMQVSTNSLDPTVPDSVMRMILDNDRIRAVRVSFKVAAPREDPTFLEGIDLDPARQGTAPVYSFESLGEIKSVAWRVRPIDL